MPEVHILGQILGASGFGDDMLFCKFKFVFGSESFLLLTGDPEDQTQLSAVSVRPHVCLCALLIRKSHNCISPAACLTRHPFTSAPHILPNSRTRPKEIVKNGHTQ